MSRGSESGRITVLLAATTFAATDLLAKAASETGLAASSVDLGLLQLRLAYNAGVAFGMGDTLPSALVLVLTAAVGAGIAVYGWRQAPRASRVERLAGGAVIGGAAANVIDRARDGVVTDYLHTGWWPTFNLADAFLVTGFIVLALRQTRPDRASGTPEAGTGSSSPAVVDRP
ncbi:signal peptidase II [Luteipulveratus halotolerans]|uniref:Lipoprotein signal peptidase n=1 Tax=Luteipulveratus halotolerans TaxID=1631356 RepID=A0A0L6CEF2_9MICO|nr:signal peptidase II [Luteipulveratus halotolerans]KNX35888.1 signal peptidase [Luteipulveratus halotolerans]